MKKVLCIDGEFALPAGSYITSIRRLETGMDREAAGELLRVAEQAVKN